MININNKRWDKITARDVKKVLSGDDDESFFYEFKSDDVSPEKLVKEISAFANTYGGYIFLGVDDNKKISGCTKWKEQRIHSTIHDSLTPTPNFDVRKFTVDGKTVFIIKITEGILPPYITGKGTIFERVSSGSFLIKDSAKLSQLYNKRIDQEKRIQSKIEFDKIVADASLPANLCGYIDIGFSVTCSDSTYLQKNFYSVDLSAIANNIGGNNSFSISRVGDAFMFTIGQMGSSDANNANYHYPTGMHDYMVVYSDCSVSFRILLFSNEGGNEVDISVVPILTGFFEDIYKALCGKDYIDIFVHALKFEKLTVLKQFVPRYEIGRHFKGSNVDPFHGILKNHRDKYGENLIVQGNRLPAYGYSLIDKRLFDDFKRTFNQDSLIAELFSSAYLHLGYIDQLEIETKSQS